jgi:hypothetical protein
VIHCCVCEFCLVNPLIAGTVSDEHCAAVVCCIVSINVLVTSEYIHMYQPDTKAKVTGLTDFLTLMCMCRN